MKMGMKKGRPATYLKLVTNSYERNIRLVELITRATDFRLDNISEKDGSYVSFMNPLDGQTVNGIVNITANGTDDGILVKMELKIDGQSVKNITTTSSSHNMGVMFSWNTSKYSDGNHTITAKATDTNPQTGEMTITVRVQNTPSPVPTILIVGLIGIGVLVLLLVVNSAAKHYRKAGGNHPRKPGQVKEFNPQPEPPGKNIKSKKKKKQIKR